MTAANNDKIRLIRFYDRLYYYLGLARARQLQYILFSKQSEINQ